MRHVRKGAFWLENCITYSEFGRKMLPDRRLDSLLRKTVKGEEGGKFTRGSILLNL